MSTILVGIVVESPSLRFNIKGQLNPYQDIEVISDVDSDMGVLRLVESHQPDVFIVCVSVPDAKMVDILNEMEHCHPQVGVLIFSDCKDWDKVMEMVQTGAAGYILNTEPPETMAEAVRPITQVETWVSPTLAGSLIREAVADEVQLKEKATLTPREQETLHWLARGHRNQEIAHEMGVAVRTARHYLHNIYTKLDLIGRNEAIVRAVKQGYGED